MARYRVPSENLVYADTTGNIGWQVGGLTPIREGWTGLLPVPGDGRYEWKGFRDSGELPFEFNPPRHYIATSNNNILPAGYTIPLGYDGWALPFRVNRVREMLAAGKKFDIADFERMQQDVTSIPARRFQQVLKEWHPAAGTARHSAVDEILQWDAVLRADSRAALIYEMWIQRLPAAVLGENGAAARPGAPSAYPRNAAQRQRRCRSRSMPRCRNSTARIGSRPQPTGSGGGRIPSLCRIRWASRSFSLDRSRGPATAIR